MLQTLIDNPSLAHDGAQRVKWYREKMKVLHIFKERYEHEKPFKGKSLLVCMHCEPKAAVRTEVLLAGGAEKIVFVGNLGSTKPDTAAYLATLPNVTVLAKNGDSYQDLVRHVAQAMTEPFDLLMDNSSSLMQQYWTQRKNWKPLGAIEEHVPESSFWKWNISPRIFRFWSLMTHLSNGSLKMKLVLVSLLWMGSCGQPVC